MRNDGAHKALPKTNWDEAANERRHQTRTVSRAPRLIRSEVNRAARRTSRDVLQTRVSTPSKPLDEDGATPEGVSQLS